MRRMKVALLRPSKLFSSFRSNASDTSLGSFGDNRNVTADQNGDASRNPYQSDDNGNDPNDDESINKGNDDTGKNLLPNVREDGEKRASMKRGSVSSTKSGSNSGEVVSKKKKGMGQEVGEDTIEQIQAFDGEAYVETKSRRKSPAASATEAFRPRKKSIWERMTNREDKDVLKGAGQQEGIETWVVAQSSKQNKRKFELARWVNLGVFEPDHVYVVLNTVKSRDERPFVYFLHVWIGEKADEREVIAAQFKATELFNQLGCEPRRFREKQGHESSMFRSYFGLPGEARNPIVKRGGDLKKVDAAPAKYVTKINFDEKPTKKDLDSAKEPTKRWFRRASNTWIVGVDTAFHDAGKGPCLEVWSVECVQKKNKEYVVNPWPTVGFFETSGVYIVMNTDLVLGEPVHKIHVWRGSDAPKHLFISALFKCSELKKRLGDLPIPVMQEIQGNESKLFKSFFGGNIEILETDLDEDELHERRSLATSIVSSIPPPPPPRSSFSSSRSGLDEEDDNEQFVEAATLKSPTKPVVKERRKSSFAGALFGGKKKDSMLGVDDQFLYAGDKCGVELWVVEPLVKRKAKTYVVKPWLLTELSSLSSHRHYIVLKTELVHADDSKTPYGVGKFKKSWTIYLWEGGDSNYLEMIAALYKVSELKQKLGNTKIPIKYENQGTESDEFQQILETFAQQSTDGEDDAKSIKSVRFSLSNITEHDDESDFDEDDEEQQEEEEAKLEQKHDENEKSIQENRNDDEEEKEEEEEEEHIVPTQQMAAQKQEQDDKELEEKQVEQSTASLIDRSVALAKQLLALLPKHQEEENINTDAATITGDDDSDDEFDEEVDQQVRSVKAASVERKRSSVKSLRLEETTTTKEEEVQEQLEEKKVVKPLGPVDPIFKQALRGKVGLLMFKVAVKRPHGVTRYVLRKIPNCDFGTFSTYDTVLVVNNYQAKPENGGKSKTRCCDIHLWIGQKSSDKEIEMGQAKAEELRAHFESMEGDRKARFFTEHQYQEEPLFGTYFKEVLYLDGGVDSFMKYDGPRLFMVRCSRKTTRAFEIPCEAKYLNHGDAFVLVCEKKVYQFTGEFATRSERFRAGMLKANILSKRNGRAKGANDLDAYFWEVLQGNIDDVRHQDDPYLPEGAE